MIIDEKGRLFSKISIIDLAIVLLLVVAIAFVGFKVVGFGKTSEITEKKMQAHEITFRINGVRQATIDALEKSVGGVVCDARSKEIGTLLRIESVEPLINNMLNDDGSLTPVEVPEKYVVKVVVDADIIRTGDSIILPNKMKLLIGSNMTISTKEIAVETAVTKIKKK
ncbi:MAG: DUF4330 domain-containing protein [Clostridia bacterium]|nr:DUF4330 domain-containing protein [Clostridia bacterium]